MAQFVPVALFAYKRPWHLIKSLESLKKNKVPMIYAFSDGARTLDVKPSVDAVRDILKSIDWCDVKLIERESNYGLGRSIRTGIGYVLERHDRVIVVEDDIILRPGAYEYTVAALQYYQNISEVMSITMWSHPNLVPKQVQGGFFSKRFVCWGWGTYADRWKKYSSSPLELYHECERRKLGVLKWGNDLKRQAESAAEKNLWYVGFVLMHFLENGLSYFPNETLTVNIGFDGSGENCGIGLVGEEEVSQPVHIPDNWPDVGLLRDVDRQFAQYFGYSPPLTSRTLKYVKEKIKKIPLVQDARSWLKK